MKKRMFITTIVMMLVLAVALTTSSLAWFSATQSFVTASTATFYAATADTQANLVIRDETNEAWGRQIQLYKSANNEANPSSNQTLQPLVPKAALVSATDIGSTFNGKIEKAGVDDVTVAHVGNVWPTAMVFNTVMIDSNNKYVITSDDSVTDYSNVTDGAGNGAYFFREFYIKNASITTDMTSLSFKLKADLSVGNDATDYTARGIAAFIIFDEVTTAKDAVIPAGALQYAGYTVIASSGTQDDNNKQVPESADGAGITTWVPFAAFTLVTQDATPDYYDSAAWQFANFKEKNAQEAYIYANQSAGNGQRDNTDDSPLHKQDYDALMARTTGESTDSGDAFILNKKTLVQLNNKKVGADGNVGVRTTVSELTYPDYVAMQAGEEYMVRMYYWLDGATLTGLTDATISTLELTIESTSDVATSIHSAQ